MNESNLFAYISSIRTNCILYFYYIPHCHGFQMPVRGQAATELPGELKKFTDIWFWFCKYDWSPRMCLCMKAPWVVLKHNGLGTTTTHCPILDWMPAWAEINPSSWLHSFSDQPQLSSVCLRFLQPVGTVNVRRFEQSFLFSNVMSSVLLISLHKDGYYQPYRSFYLFNGIAHRHLLLVPPLVNTTATWRNWLLGLHRCLSFPWALG